MSEGRQLVGTGDVIVFLITVPISILGLVWLALVSDLDTIRRSWSLFLLLAVMILIFNRVKYFIIVEIRTDRYGSADGSLASVVQWAGVFLLGPTALWLSLLGTLISFGWNWRKMNSEAARWNLLRGSVMELAAITPAYLIALAFYRNMGGTYPIAELNPSTLLVALGTLAVHLLIVIMIWSVYTVYAVWIQRILTQSFVIRPVYRFLFLALGLPTLANPFSILLAVLYLQNGLFAFFFFSIGLLMVAYLTRQLSWAAEGSRQQSKELEKLEHLGRDIINAPLDASTLSNLLIEHVPSMFPSGRVVIWLHSDRFLLKHPEDWNMEIEPIWQWVEKQTECAAFLARDLLPWFTEKGEHGPIVLTPIMDAVRMEPIGCVYIELRSLAQPWDRKALSTLTPAVKTLADQVASALHQAEMYEGALDYQFAIQELEFAGRIQASFLPNELPRLDGWELAVTFLPARETSGDFFDFIPLPDGKVGILIADVADKGVGAALYMALSRTLIRTYALEYEAQPDIIFFSANERILQDARAELFVTAFYGILDPKTGNFTYSNAGHNPPLLMSSENGFNLQALTTNNMPLGVDEDATWHQQSIQIQPGNVLLLYTDGIPDAQNKEEAFFKEKRLIEVVHPMIDSSAQEIQNTLINTVQDFVGDASQFDDITLLVIKRDLECTKS